uniref:LysM peptidoglycan-binding domain-containing protein n=1 Tax=Waltera acetigignens TaxID=2981769 RepID=UPI003F7EE78C
MKKQRRRIYAALLCSSMVLSLVSTPVSAAETGQLTNPPTSTEELSSPESISGNEAAAILNGLYAALPVANGVKEVATAEELTAALADSSISGITLKGDVEISSTLTVNRTVTLDLNGNVLKMTGGFSVIKVESGGDLTIADSTPNKVHKFNPNYTDMWGCGLWKLDKDTGTEIVSGGVITGGGGDFAHSDGGGVLVNVGGKLTMTGGSIVGCSAGGLGGGVHLAYDSSIGKSSTFTMTGGSIIGCAAKNGGGVSVSPGCTFTMGSGSEIRNCNAQSGGGGVDISALWNSNTIGCFIMNGGTIRTCTGLYGGGVYNSGSFIMSGGTIKASISTTPQYASSGGVWNDNQFTMTGGTIGDPGNPNDASSVYNTSTQRVTLTISGNAKIYTDVTNVGILNADGGEMSGTMTNDTNRYGTGTITGSEGAAGSTEFHGKVTNTGTIRKGTFKNEVINESSGTINGGTFTGTITNNDGTVLDGDFSGATTLSGTLVITFDPNNGDQPSTQKANWSKDGAALTAPDPVPTKEGHSIEGWYYDNNGTETKWNFDTDTVKCTMTLKAKWELSTYSVTLQTDGGTIASGKEVTGYTYGTGAVLPTTNDITREGYRFDGWYADSNFSGSPVTEITGTDTGNKTFYAKWTRNTTPIISGNTINYIVEHYKTDGSGYTLAETEHSAGKTGDTVTATPKTYEGFTYNPAISTASGTLKKISGPEDIVTLKLYYDVNADTEQESTESGSEEKADRENPSPVVKNTTSYMTYTVQAGDTLWAIARKYNCSITGIVAANSDRIKNPNRIHAGWQLKIPQSGAPITGGTPDAVLPENKKSGIYIVRQGDTLWAIARKCGCSVAEIVSLNRELIRNPALIHSGWELKVPQD